MTFVHTIDIQVERIAGETMPDKVQEVLKKLDVAGINTVKRGKLVLNLNQYAGRELHTLTDAQTALDRFCSECQIKKYRLSRVDVCCNFDVPFAGMQPLGTFLVDCWRVLYPRGMNAYVTQPSERITELGWKWDGCTCIMYDKAAEVAARGTNTIGSHYETRVEMQLFPRRDWQDRQEERKTSIAAIVQQYAARNLSKIDANTILDAVNYRYQEILYLRAEARNLTALIDRTRAQIYAFEIVERLYEQEQLTKSL